MKVLEGVTVIDFTQTYSGPFCTMQLADFGAKVIKIERKGIGDTSRYWEPLRNNHSGYFAAINRNKYSVEIDLSSKEGIKIVDELIENADIVVENFKTGTMEKLGIGYDDIFKYKPDIIYASLSGYGQTGPLKNYPAYDNIIQSVSGLMDMTGFPEKSPTKAGPSISDSLASLNMALGILLAYYHKLNTGEGQRVDVSMLDSLFGILESPILFKSLLGVDVTRCGNNDAATLVPYDVYQCKDGYFSAGLAGDSGWDKFAGAMNMPELIADPRFSSNTHRCMNFNELDQILKDFFNNRTKQELQDAFTNAGIPNAPVLTVAEIMEHQQLKDRDMIMKINDPGIGEYTAIGNPMKMDQNPAAYEKAAPLLGENTDEILMDLGYTDLQIKNLRIAGVI